MEMQLNIRDAKKDNLINIAKYITQGSSSLINHN